MNLLEKGSLDNKLRRWPLIVNIYLAICFEKYKLHNWCIDLYTTYLSKKSELIHHLSIFQNYLVKKEQQSEPFKVK